MLNLSSKERIIVKFDDVASIGETQGLHAGFCGTLSIDNSIFPIGFVKWNDLPESYFNRYFGQIIKRRPELMANVPNRISPDEWTSYVDYRLDNKTQMVEIGHNLGQA
ncbi:hypothetical protein FXO38_20029 [Capsicum annuum]|nr:hypothetical protein FXO38_20029 [Capsicum annuum]KAF3647629.1 hypothetical protein FXO37_19848 [Capsicum annuum]